jgi:predicted DNA-binding transcriptional regulator YafY
MSRHLERLLQIDTLLRCGQRQTSFHLAQALEVSERTIRSDLAFLRDRFHAPLEYKKKTGWRYTDSTWRLPSIPLSTGAQMVNLDPQIWQQLLEACRTSQRIWIHYYAATRLEESQRAIDPYLLHIYRATNPYLIGFCHKRQEIRWFRIDRIKELRVLDETFERDPNFDARTYLEKIFQHEVGGHPVTVAIWFDTSTAPFIRERRWHVTQEIEEHADGSLTLHLVTSGLNDLKRWVLGYGKGAVVKEPPELVKLVRSLSSEKQEYLENEGVRLYENPQKLLADLADEFLSSEAK